MSLHQARTGIRSKTAIMAGLGAAATLAPANAAEVTVGARGATTITLGGRAITTLEAGTCGTLSATAQGGAAATSTPKGLKMTLKVSGFESNANSVIAVLHTGA